MATLRDSISAFLQRVRGQLCACGKVALIRCQAERYSDRAHRSELLREYQVRHRPFPLPQRSYPFSAEFKDTECAKGQFTQQ